MFAPNIEFVTQSIKNITHYILDDGRIWSIEEAKFVNSIPKNGYGTGAPDEHGNSTIEGLISCLDFYHYPKGELKTDAEYASEVRKKRNQLLTETDYLVMSDYPLADDKRESVLDYRQALRDVPMQAGFPRQINWPLKPF